MPANPIDSNGTKKPREREGENVPFLALEKARGLGTRSPF